MAIILETGIFMYCLTKRLGIIKLKSYFSLLKLNSEIIKKRKNIEKIRKYSDSDIIKKFSNEFILPQDFINTKNVGKMNSIIISLSKIARNLINI